MFYRNKNSNSMYYIYLTVSNDEEVFVCRDVFSGTECVIDNEYVSLSDFVPSYLN